ncbi:tyrosine-type recombinase/integrase [Kribbella sp. ALI-6-A]|uniref:tyrosine-type recombinase/integrase n=1 Tax=Kribbella sp. ALI-6-A TaxID=1933817 RepID=UPI0009FDEF1A
MFHAPQGRTVGVSNLRVHDLRHTAGSVWPGSGADPKVVPRILGHASAAMTMPPGHLIDQNLCLGRRPEYRGHHGARKRIEAGNDGTPG